MKSQIRFFSFFYSPFRRAISVFWSFSGLCRKRICRDVVDRRLEMRIVGLTQRAWRRGRSSTGRRWTILRLISLRRKESRKEIYSREQKEWRRKESKKEVERWERWALFCRQDSPEWNMWDSEDVLKIIRLIKSQKYGSFTEVNLPRDSVPSLHLVSFQLPQSSLCLLLLSYAFYSPSRFFPYCPAVSNPFRFSMRSSIPASHLWSSWVSLSISGCATDWRSCCCCRWFDSWSDWMFLFLFLFFFLDGLWAVRYLKLSMESKERKEDQAQGSVSTTHSLILLLPILLFSANPCELSARDQQSVIPRWTLDHLYQGNHQITIDRTLLILILILPLLLPIIKCILKMLSILQTTTHSSNNHLTHQITLLLQITIDTISSSLKQQTKGRLGGSQITLMITYQSPIMSRMWVYRYRTASKHTASLYYEVQRPKGNGWVQDSLSLFPLPSSL